MIEVRPARPGELAAVGNLTMAAYDSDGHLHADDDYAGELLDAARRARDAELLVAVEGPELLGTVTVAEHGSPYAEVSHPDELEFRMLGVDPAARGRGAGRALVQAVLERAEVLGCAGVVISTQERMVAARSIYTRLGFARVPERDWEPVPGLVLQVMLRPRP
ncbi:MAG: GNAT family N-acetyltransferase [Mycobacteriaceae bacterium]